MDRFSRENVHRSEGFVGISIVSVGARWFLEYFTSRAIMQSLHLIKPKGGGTSDFYCSTNRNIHNSHSSIYLNICLCYDCIEKRKCLYR